MKLFASQIAQNTKQMYVNPKFPNIISYDSPLFAHACTLGVLWYIIGIHCWPNEAKRRNFNIFCKIFFAIYSSRSKGVSASLNNVYNVLLLC